MIKREEKGSGRGTEARLRKTSQSFQPARGHRPLTGFYTAPTKSASLSSPHSYKREELRGSSFIWIQPPTNPLQLCTFCQALGSRTSDKNILHFWAAGTSSSFSHSRRRPREERNYRNPALMQQHCSTAGWNTTQPWHGLALQGGTQTPKWQRIQEERQNNYASTAQKESKSLAG